MVRRPSTVRFSLLLAGLLLAVVLGLSQNSPRQVHAIPPLQQLPTVGFTSPSYNADEDDGTVNITVGISSAPNAEVRVGYLTLPGTAEENVDYRPASGTLIFPSGSTANQQFTIQILNNTIFNQGDRTVNLVLQLQTTDTAVLGRGTAVLTIDEDDIATNTPPPSQATATRIFVDDAEPNETFDDSFTIAVGAAATCRLTLWPPGDIDFYRFSVKSGSFYRVLTDDLSPGLDTVMEVFNTTGGRVAQNDDVGGTENIGDRRSEAIVRADADGFFYARVVNKDGTDPAGLTYCMQVEEILEPSVTPTPTVLPVREGADDAEPNGRLELAYLLNENSQGNFNFVPPYNEGPDNDYYKLWVRPGITYTCETEIPPESVADTNIIFLDANGNDFNPQLGNNDKDINDRGSRLTYFSTYTGYLHILVGPVNPVPLDEAPRNTYTLSCVSEVAPTATPTLAPRPPQPPGTGGGGGGVVVPTVTPMDTPTEQPTIDFSFLTPSPVVIPVVTIQPLPTATPFSGGQQAATVNVTVYYDSNFNFMPEPAEGIVDIAVFLYDNATGRLIAFGYTNAEGIASFPSVATTGAVRVEVPFLNFRQIVGAGESNILLRVAPQPLPIGIP